MTEELKTLKDITNPVLPYCADKKEIKAEAIKWVKRFREKEMWQGAAAISEFHNITEDDLELQKGGKNE